MHLVKKIIFGALWSLALVSACGPGTVEPGTETTNGIVIAVADNKLSGTSSDPAATLILCDTRLVPGFKGGLLDTFSCDNKGAFFFENIPEGFYNLFAYPRQAGRGAVIQTVPVKAGSAFSDSAAFDSLNKISGVVLHNTITQKKAMIHIAGSPFRTVSDTNGRFGFDKIPKGTFTVIAWGDSADSYGSSWEKAPKDTQKVNFNGPSFIGQNKNPPDSAFITFTLKP